MNLQKILVPVGGALLVAAGYRAWGWGGVALAVGALLLWLLLHFTRVMHVLRRAADSPVGHVGSAVMLHARLRHRQSLLHVVALTQSLGARLSPKDQQPEAFRWTDTSGATVTCEFRDGRLDRWELRRPAAAGDAAPDGRPAP